jgi:hypothetical protein
MLAGSLVCEQDWHKLVKTAAPNPTPPLRKGKGKIYHKNLFQKNLTNYFQ